MTKRPLSITIIAWLFIVAGAVGLAYHGSEFNAQRPFASRFLWVCLLRFLAIVAGFFLLRGKNWARWLLAFWLAYHVALSALHAPVELIVHGLLFLAVLYFLFRPSATAYFRPATVSASLSSLSSSS